jgi:Yip1-like protein
MTNTTTAPGATSAPMNVFARFIGIITSPRATFQAVVADPKWLGMLLIVALSASLLSGGLLMTKVGQDAWLDAAANSGRQLNEQQLQGLERIAPFVGYFAFAVGLIGPPLLAVIISGLLFAVFNAALGGMAKFKQVFAVVVHAMAIGVLGQLFTVPLNYSRGTLTSATNLAVFTQSFLSDTSFVARLLGTIELFLVWQILVLAMGLGVLYRRRTQPIAMSFFGLYALIGIIIAVVKTAFGRS